MDKIKIKQSEIDELYDVEDDGPESKALKVDHVNATIDFEEYTEKYDEEKKKEELD